MTPPSTSPRPDPHTIVLFGATGDLAARKLIPGFLRLESVGLMPDDYRIIGTSRRSLSDEEFREHARDVVDRSVRVSTGRRRMGPLRAAALLRGERRRRHGPARDRRGAGRHVRSGPMPARSPTCPSRPSPWLGSSRASALRAWGRPHTRAILEKPFGTDAESAKALNATLHGVFSEEQIFRIDHFLGKEDVQNILVVRFGNQLFEPMWCAEHVQSIQIDVPETLGVENRAEVLRGDRERSGAWWSRTCSRCSASLAMEPPSAFSADACSRSRSSGSSVRSSPSTWARVVRGQYDGYLEHFPTSLTTRTPRRWSPCGWRSTTRVWASVPILLRTGKELPEGRRVITLRLDPPPMQMFPEDGLDHGGEIVFKIGEPGGIRINFRSKEPGPVMVLGPAHFDFTYRSDLDPAASQAYERLLHDAMLGDRTLFTGPRASNAPGRWPHPRSPTRHPSALRQGNVGTPRGRPIGGGRRVVPARRLTGASWNPTNCTTASERHVRSVAGVRECVQHGLRGRRRLADVADHRGERWPAVGAAGRGPVVGYREPGLMLS